VRDRRRATKNKLKLNDFFRRETDVADKTDVLLQLFAEERAQARQSEDQRATLTNIILIVVGASLAFVSQRGLDQPALIVSIPIIAIGIFGALTNGKYFERWLRHWRRAYAYEAQLFELHPEIQAKRGRYSSCGQSNKKDAYESEVDARFPRLSRMKLWRMWINFHWGVALLGIVLTLAILATIVK
jgi:hypothetical protein